MPEKEETLDPIVSVKAIIQVAWNNDREKGETFGAFLTRSAEAILAAGYTKSIKGNSCREALEDMVWEFAHRTVRDGKAVLWSGFNSTLRDAFRALGWEDPKIVEDTDGIICDVLGCPGWVVSQGGLWMQTGFWYLCDKHNLVAINGKPQPEMKQRAMDREATRRRAT